jgi:formylglycine-generating enzyme required for sulfatase activity
MPQANLPLLEWLDIRAGSVKLEGTAAPLDVRPFQIARYPVTNEQFDTFIQDGGYKEKTWWDGLEQTGGSPRKSDWSELDSPKLQVCWYEAVAFSR